MYIAAGQGPTNPVDKILMSTETCCHFGHLLKVPKKKKKKKFFEVQFYTMFHDFMYVLATQQELTTTWGRNFDINRNILSLQSFVASFKKNLFEV